MVKCDNSYFSSSDISVIYVNSLFSNLKKKVILVTLNIPQHIFKLLDFVNTCSFVIVENKSH